MVTLGIPDGLPPSVCVCVGVFRSTGCLMTRTEGPKGRQQALGGSDWKKQSIDMRRSTEEYALLFRLRRVSMDYHMASMPNGADRTGGSQARGSEAAGLDLPGSSGRGSAEVRNVLATGGRTHWVM